MVINNRFNNFYESVYHGEHFSEVASLSYKSNKSLS